MRWLTFCFLFCSTVLASISLTQQEQTYLASKKQITIGAMDGWPPMNFIDYKNRPQGIGADLVAALNQRMDGKLTIISGPWQEIYEKAKSGKLDAILDITPKPEREEFFHFTEPYLRIPHVIVGRKDATTLHSLDALLGKSVALEAGIGTIRYLQQNYPRIKIREYRDTSTALDSVNRGESDAYVGNRAVADYLIKQELLSNLKIHSRDTTRKGSVLTIGVHQSQPILRDILQKALDDITHDEKNAILSRWSNEKDVNIGLTPKERAYLRGKKELHFVTASEAWPPFLFTAKEGSKSGLEMEFLDLLQSRIHTPINVTHLPWKEAVKQAKGHRFDAIFPASATEDRKPYLNFSQSYYLAPLALYARSDLPGSESWKEFQGKRIAAVAGSSYIELITQHRPDIEQIHAKDSAHALLMVAEGKADGTLDMLPVLKYYADAMKLTKQVKPLLYIYDKSHGGSKYGIRNDEPLLHSIIDKAINSYTSAEKSQIETRWQGTTSTTSGFTPQEKAWLQNNPTIRLAYMNYWPTDNEGHNIHTEYVRLLSEYAKLNISLVRFDTWKDAYAKAKQGDYIHGIMNLSWSKEREHNDFDYTPVYFFEPAYLIVRQDNETIKNLEDLVNQNIYLKEKSITTQIIEDLKYNIQPLYQNTDSDLLKALSSNSPQADALLTFTFDREELESYGLKVTEKIFNRYGEIHIGTSQNQPELHAILSQSFTKIPKPELSKIQNKNYEKVTKIAVNLTPQEKAFLRQHKTIRVHNETSWPPFNFYEFGQPKGYSVELMNKIAEKTGMNIEYITGPTWDQFLKMAKEGKIDVMINAVKTPEREKYLNFTDPFLRATHGIFVRKDDRSINRFDDLLQGKSIAVVKGYYYHEYLKKHHPEIQLHLLDSEADALKAVAFGTADATMGITATLQYSMEKNFITNLRFFEDPAAKIFESIPLSLAARKDAPELVSILQKGLGSLSAKEQREIAENWLSGTKESVVDLGLTHEERKWLKEHQVIKFTGDPDWLPFEKFEEGQYSGIVAEHLKIIEERLGVVFEKVEPTSWNHAIEMAADGTVDMISEVVAENTISQTMDYTKPYLDTPLVVVTRKDQNQKFTRDLNEINNQKIAVVQDYGYVESLKNEYPDIRFLEVKSVREGLEDVASGEIDAFVCTLAVGAYSIGVYALPNLEISGKLPLKMELGFGVKKEWSPLITILNKAIDLISPEESRKIDQKWIGSGFADFDKKVTLSGQEKAWVEKQRAIRYVYDADWAPFEWKNELNEHTGIIYDILSLIEERSGIRFEQIPTNEWSEAVALMENDSADMYSGVGENEKRKAYLNFTNNTIFETPYVFVTRTDDKNDYLETFLAIENKKVAVVDGYAIHGILKDNRPKLPLLIVKSIQEGFDKVQDNAVDIFIVNAASAKYFINRMGYDDLKIATKTEFNLELKIALQKELPPVVLSIIDKAIETISEKERSDIYFKWTEALIEEKIDYALILEILAVAAILVLGMVWWNRTMFREIKQRKAAQAQLHQAMHELQESQEYLQQVLDAQVNIVITTDGKRIRTANRAFLKFFLLDSLEAFLAEYQCICDTFEQSERGYLQKWMGEQTWVEYLLSHPEKTHRASIRGSIFTVEAAPFRSGREQFHLAVFTDITPLDTAQAMIAESNRKITDSIRYASLIQGALLPDEQVMQEFFDDHFILWQPKDVVGGDLFLYEPLRNDEEALLMVIDCTGHGVPGAFMTMLVKAVERNIIGEILQSEQDVHPAKILQIFNRTIRTLLRQDHPDAASNAGFDGGILYFDKSRRLIRYAGAETPLFYFENKGDLKTIKGDRQSIGYRTSDPDFVFTEHELAMDQIESLLLTTDGYLDQNGGEKGFPFGKKRLKAILEGQSDKLGMELKEILLKELGEWQKKEERNDDVTVIGVKINKEFRHG